VNAWAHRHDRAVSPTCWSEALQAEAAMPDNLLTFKKHTECIWEVNCFRSLD